MRAAINPFQLSDTQLYVALKGATSLTRQEVYNMLVTEAMMYRVNTRETSAKLRYCGSPRWLIEKIQTAEAFLLVNSTRGCIRH